MNIEDKIKLLVKAKGMKMEFVYNSIGMSGPGFYKMLRNETYSVNMLQKIADVLNVPIVDFFETGDYQRLDLIRMTANIYPKLAQLKHDAYNYTEKGIEAYEDIAYSFEVYTSRMIDITHRIKNDKSYAKKNILADIDELNIASFLVDEPDPYKSIEIQKSWLKQTEGMIKTEQWDGVKLTKEKLLEQVKNKREIEKRIKRLEAKTQSKR